MYCVTLPGFIVALGTCTVSPGGLHCRAVNMHCVTWPIFIVVLFDIYCVTWVDTQSVIGTGFIVALLTRSLSHLAGAVVSICAHLYK